MASVVYYKFKSGGKIRSFPIVGTSVPVKQLKRELFASIYSLCKHRMPFDDILISDARTDEEYLDEDANIPRNASISIRRVPRLRLNPIIVEPPSPPPPVHEGTVKVVESKSAHHEIYFYDDFGPDIYAVPAVVAHSSNFVKVSTESIDQKSTLGFGHDSGRVERIRKPPARSNVWNRSCSLQPRQDIHKHRSSTYNMIKPQEVVAKPIQTVVMKKQFEMSFPLELQWPLCKKLMREAMLTRCCFRSFCAKCIGDYLISNSACTSGLTTTKPDHLIPNRTVRELVTGVESSSSSSSRGSSSSSSVVTSESSFQVAQGASKKSALFQ